MDNEVSYCICPICGSNECKIDTDKETKIEARVCDECGYMTLSTLRVKSAEAEKFEQTTTQLVKDLRKEDTDIGQYWYPSTMYVNTRGALFPVGTKENWKYGFSAVVPIPIHERLDYPMPDKPGYYYEMRLEFEKIKTFDNFKDAIKMFE